MTKLHARDLTRDHSPGILSLGPLAQDLEPWLEILPKYSWKPSEPNRLRGVHILRRNIEEIHARVVHIPGKTPGSKRLEGALFCLIRPQDPPCHPLFEMSVCLSVCFYNLSVCRCLSVLFVCPSVCLSVCLSVPPPALGPGLWPLQTDQTPTL